MRLVIGGGTCAVAAVLFVARAAFACALADEVEEAPRERVSHLAHEGCHVAGRLELLEVTVRPTGAEPFVVVAEDAGVVATPTVNGISHLAIEGPFRFAGWGEPGYYAAGAVESEGGLAHLDGHRVRNVRPDGPGVVVDVGSDSAVVRMRRVSLPCSAVALAYPEDAPSGDEPELPQRDDVPRFVLLADWTTVHALPGGRGPSIDVGGMGSRSMEVLAFSERSGWLRVSSRLSQFDGEWFSGWVRARGAEEVVYDENGLGIGDNWGCGGLGLSPIIERRPPPSVLSSHFERPGRLSPGTAVHAEPGGAQWAEVGRGRTDLSVSVLAEVRGSWIRVVEAPGIREQAACEHSLCHAWVRREHVTFVPEHLGDGGPGTGDYVDSAFEMDVVAL